MAESFHTFVNDLGVAAYLMMHGYSLSGKRDRSIYFECQSQNEVEEFENLVLDYQPPNEFYIFDSCLMWLKKTNEHTPKDLQSIPHKVVDDLGVAAYLLLKEHDPDTKLGIRVIGKHGKYVYFSCPEGKDEEFDRRWFLYLKSQFQNYDSCLMAIKKIGGTQGRTSK